MNQTIEFTSKSCKSNLHTSCVGKWEGFGFEVICVCHCKHNHINAGYLMTDAMTMTDDDIFTSRV